MSDSTIQKKRSASITDSGAGLFEYLSSQGWEISMKNSNDLMEGEWCKILDSPSEEEKAELRKSLNENGILSALIINENDEIIDGTNRFRIGKELGIASFPCLKISRISKSEIEKLVLSLQLGRRNLTPINRDELVGRLYQLRKSSWGGDRKSVHHANVACCSGGDTASEIAKEYGISARTVKNAGARVSFTEKYSQFRNESTINLLELKKSLANLRRSQKEDLLTWGSIKGLAAEDMILAAKLMYKCGETVQNALNAIEKGIANDVLEQERNSYAVQSECDNRCSRMCHSHTRLNAIMDRLKNIIKAGKESGEEMCSFPWLDLENLQRENNNYLARPMKDGDYTKVLF